MENKTKEELILMRENIEKELLNIAQKEQQEEALKKRELNILNGKYTPLKHGIVTEDIYWCSGDETIESQGFGVASDFLGSPYFEKGEKMVLIRNSDDELIWVPSQEDGDYMCYNDISIHEDEVYDMIQIIQK